jgi:hypothetical protein
MAILGCPVIVSPHSRGWGWLLLVLRMVGVLDGGVRCQLFSPVGRLVMALLRRPRRPGLGPVSLGDKLVWCVWCGSGLQ